MQQPWMTSFRLALCALTLVAGSTAYAQASAMPGHSTQRHSAAAMEAGHAQKNKAADSGKHGKHYADKHRKHQRKKNNHNHSAHQSPQHAAHGAHQHGTGSMPHSASSDAEYQRNMLRRCDIYKTDDDRHACEQRMLRPQISGSVEGGGLIREYTQQVPAPHMPQKP